MTVLQKTAILPWHLRFRRPWYEDPGSYLETTASPAKSDAELLMKRGELVQYRVGTILEFRIIWDCLVAECPGNHSTIRANS